MQMQMQMSRTSTKRNARSDKRNRKGKTRAYNSQIVAMCSLCVHVTLSFDNIHITYDINVAV